MTGQQRGPAGRGIVQEVKKGGLHQGLTSLSIGPPGASAEVEVSARYGVNGSDCQWQVRSAGGGEKEAMRETTNNPTAEQGRSTRRPELLI